MRRERGERFRGERRELLRGPLQELARGGGEQHELRIVVLLQRRDGRLVQLGVGKARLGAVGEDRHRVEGDGEGGWWWHLLGVGFTSSLMSTARMCWARLL